jgi:hypothetical protein
MKKYFHWHRIQRERLSKDNWTESRFLVSVCLQEATTCGGTADRLRPIPFLILVAAKSQRIFLIHWDKPARLEEFLLPTVGGVDWRTPEYIERAIRDSSLPRGITVNTLLNVVDSNATIVKSQVQSHDHGSSFYNREAVQAGEEEGAFRRHYPDLWHAMFIPSKDVARMVNNILELGGLLPGNFGFAHVRANYDIEDVGREPKLVEQWAKNALNCLSNIQPGGPYYFASDSFDAKQVAVLYGKYRNVTVVATGEQSLHLDRDANWETREVSEYFPVFVDLYVGSFAKCFSVNVGGFGTWAMLLSKTDSFSCKTRHWTKGVSKAHANKDGCSWTSPHRLVNVSDEQLFDANQAG